MAEVTTNSNTRKKGVNRISTKIDMTPMVDLAFLLITFFMLTTTFSKPTVMQLQMPIDEGPKINVPETRTTTIILGKNDQVFYYTGIRNPKLEYTNYAAKGIRKVIIDKLHNTHNGPIFVIKAMENSRYKNVIDILDEMEITNAQTYALVDITPEDISLVDQYKQEHNMAE
jgi:biopolymer transport protein ExbD